MCYLSTFYFLKYVLCNTFYICLILNISYDWEIVWWQFFFSDIPRISGSSDYLLQQYSMYSVGVREIIEDDLNHSAMNTGNQIKSHVVWRSWTQGHRGDGLWNTFNSSAELNLACRWTGYVCRLGYKTMQERNCQSLYPYLCLSQGSFFG